MKAYTSSELIVFTKKWSIEIYIQNMKTMVT